MPPCIFPFKLLYTNHMPSLKVFIATPEALPFAKTGGLADVTGALPKVLKGLGQEVTIGMPLYRAVAEGGFEIRPTGCEVSIPLYLREVSAPVLQGSANGIPTYFFKRDEFYDRSYLYGTPDGDYFDNLERFTLLTRGILEALKGLDFKPDIIHCHDWQTGLIPAYLKTLYKNDPFFQGTATLFTIHNIAYQGLFPKSYLPLTGLPYEVFKLEGMEFWGKISLLKAGIVFSELITTVSERYSHEIQTEEYGYGLEGILRARRDDLFGVLNGVDYEEWNPAHDRFIVANYNENDISGKARCKEDLLKEYDLNLPLNTPLIGIISRLADQKGFDILAEAMDRLMAMDLGMVVLGTGDRKYHELFEGLARKYPTKLGVKIAFSNTLAHKIEAGCDMFLMPSRYEPCGMNQIYSLKYGTIPIVRATGGLDDTIQDYLGTDLKSAPTEKGNGFKFAEYSSRALIDKIKEALQVFKDKRRWRGLIKRAMLEDFSWERSARRYLELYQRAIEKKATYQPR